MVLHRRCRRLAARRRIFDPYVQLADAKSPTARYSRGLYLRFCYLAAAAHGGRIWVEDAEPHGSVFRVSLASARNWPSSEK